MLEAHLYWLHTNDIFEIHSNKLPEWRFHAARNTVRVSGWLHLDHPPIRLCLKSIIDSKEVSGPLENAVVSIVIVSEQPSLLVQSGAEPEIVIEEKIAGRPSYTGRYIANAVGSYTLAVMQLENGGLNAKYYDNQRLLDEPVIERGPLLSFISADDLKVELEA